MNEKPWHAVAREYFGYVSWLSWPYRAYQWLRPVQQERIYPTLGKATYSPGGPPPLSAAPVLAPQTSASMRVTIEHKEEKQIFGANRYYVVVRVMFSDVAKKIIKTRKLYEQVVLEGYDKPPNSGAGSALSAAGVGLGPLMMLVGFGLGLASIGGAKNLGEIGGFLIFAGIFVWIFGYVGPNALSRNVRTYKIRDLMKGYPLKLYADDPLDAKELDDKIRQTLRGLKIFLEESQQLRKPETFEL